MPGSSNTIHRDELDDVAEMTCREVGSKLRTAKPIMKKSKTNKISVVRPLQNQMVNTHQSYADDSFNAERVAHEETLRSRNEKYKAIIMNNPTELSWLRLSKFSLGSVVFGIISTFPLSLIPAHDLLQYPEFWYELLFHQGWACVWTYCFRLLECASYLNFPYIQLRNNVMSICLSGVFVGTVLVIAAYHIWTHTFKYIFPIPWFGFAFTWTNAFIFFIVLWLSIPAELKEKQNLKERMAYFVLQSIVNFIAIPSLGILINVIKRCSDEYQPVVALTFPAIRELIIWISSKLLRKSTNGDLTGALMVLKYRYSLHYTIILCMIVGTIATDRTSWILMFVDISINIFWLLRLIWLKKRRSHMIQQQIDSLQDLALGELVEFHGPLAYIFVIGITYISPNGELFGNIGNSYWGYEAIEDIEQTLMNMLFLFGVDFSTTIICAALLWIFCRINIWIAFLELQTEFGTIFCVFLGRLLITVSSDYIF